MATVTAVSAPLGRRSCELPVSPIRPSTRSSTGIATESARWCAEEDRRRPGRCLRQTDRMLRGRGHAKPLHYLLSDSHLQIRPSPNVVQSSAVTVIVYRLCDTARHNKLTHIQQQLVSYHARSRSSVRQKFGGLIRVSLWYSRIDEALERA
jgi:hypothetical protein